MPTRVIRPRGTPFVLALIGGFTLAGVPAPVAAATAAAPGASAAATLAPAPAQGEITTGSRVPTPLMVTPIQGRMPSFREPEQVTVLVFVNLAKASSRDAMAQLGTLQTEYGKRVTVVAIAEEGPDDVRAFLARPEWSDRIMFTVASDPERSAIRAFFGPQSAPVFPIAFVLQQGVVQWRGKPADLAEPVAGVVRGNWDVAAAQRLAEQRELWKKLIGQVHALADAGRYDEALAKLQDVCYSAIGDQQDHCLSIRFDLLVRAGRLNDALAVGETILAKPMNAKQPAGLAWALLSKAPGDPEVCRFALRAAQASDKALRSRDPMVLAILARAQFANGHRSQAVETARRALALADTPDMTEALQEDLRQYEAATNAKP